MAQQAAAKSPAPKRVGRDESSAQAEPHAAASTDALNYAVDFAQRSVLFLDTLRRRGNIMLEHERAGLPNVLHFDYELVLDARRFDRPANYALLRITGEHGLKAEERLVPDERPVMIIDPRAGHGPGIGGFKRDSEVGMALREGHPCYFVIFYPEPEPGQTLADVLDVLRRFVDEVRSRHDGRAPVVYGNCQAGWAVAMLSAHAPGLSGPAVLNGAPLSYWAGDPGGNPMRVMGSLSGGAFWTNLLADIGDGRLDGAWLVMNFENLQPERAQWGKYTNLFRHVDDQQDSFLEFERWWNGWYSLSREEILATVENLFIGDRLEQGKLRVCEGCEVDMREIRNPMVVFASSGDNITPPYEALGWIPAIYRNTQALKDAGQRIVYLINPHVGHLGIFVSAKVARLEHRAILEHQDELESLDPGLYEMKIHNPSGSKDSHKGEYHVTFEPRKVESLRRYAPHPETFRRVSQVSEFNEAIYRTFVAPWVQAAVNPWTAELSRWFHPMRLNRYMWSDRFNPWMRGLSMLAEQAERNRQPAREGSPFLEAEDEAVKSVSEVLEAGRKARDAWLEAVFNWVYGD